MSLIMSALKSSSLSRSHSRDMVTSELEWEDPPKGSAAMWTGFKRSKEVFAGNRRNAKCNQCSTMVRSYQQRQIMLSQQLFSTMGYIKPKSRNRMLHGTLSTLARSKLLLSDQTSMRSESRVILSADDLDQFAVMNTFDALLEIAPGLDEESPEARVEALMEQYFDFDAFDALGAGADDAPMNGGEEEEPIRAAPEAWDIDEIVGECL